MVLRRSLRALLPLSVGFLLLIASALASLWMSFGQQRAVGWVRHTLEVENRIDLIRGLVTDAESGQRGYLLTGQSVYLEPYDTAVAGLTGQIEALGQATDDNPAERRNLDVLRAAVQRKLNEIGGSIALAHLGRGADAVAVVRTDSGRRYMAQVRDALAQMVREEDRLLAARSANLGWFTTASRAALILSALLVIILAYFAVRDGSRRLTALEKTNRALRARFESHA